uniref:Uncharacterized protein n=1 Tax=Oryza meridionalis TaxID=40149 RepID=A0A0E0ELH0_9ORYZ
MPLKKGAHFGSSQDWRSAPSGGRRTDLSRAQNDGVRTRAWGEEVELPPTTGGGEPRRVGGGGGGGEVEGVRGVRRRARVRGWGVGGAQA